MLGSKSNFGKNQTVVWMVWVVVSYFPYRSAVIKLPQVLQEFIASDLNCLCEATSRKKNQPYAMCMAKHCCKVSWY